MERWTIPSRPRRSSSSTTRCRPRTCGACTRKPSATSGMLLATSPGTRPEPYDGRVLADELIDIHGSPIWAKMSEKDRVELNRRITAWRLSVLVYGEQGALLACSQLVDIVTGADEKFFQATQVVDEARHNEVLERYIQHRLGGLHYPMPENERVLFDVILGDPRWYIKTIALQLVAETFAVSLFKMMGECAPRSRAPRGLPAHPPGRVAPHGLRHAAAARDRSRGQRRRSAGRWRTSPAWRSRRCCRASSRSRPTRTSASPRPRSTRCGPTGATSPPERLRGVPEVLQARHARLDGDQPRAHRSAHRARPAAPRRARRRAARRRLTTRSRPPTVGPGRPTVSARRPTARGAAGPGSRMRRRSAGPPRGRARRRRAPRTAARR